MFQNLPNCWSGDHWRLHQQPAATVSAANAKEHTIEYPAARDPDLASQKAWAVHYYPTYAVIDRNGIVRAIGLQPEHVETVVQKLLAETADK